MGNLDIFKPGFDRSAKSGSKPQSTEPPNQVWLTVFEDDKEPRFVMADWNKPDVRNTEPGDYVATRPHHKVEYVPAKRPYFCSCGSACTAEEYITHYFELGHDHGINVKTPASAAPVVDNDALGSAVVNLLNAFHGSGHGGVDYMVSARLRGCEKCSTLATMLDRAFGRSAAPVEQSLCLHQCDYGGMPRCVLPQGHEGAHDYSSGVKSARSG